MTMYILAGVFACMTCLLSLRILIRLAPIVGLLDEPDLRKRHSGVTPLVGGVAIYSAFLLSQLAFDNGMVNWSLVWWFGFVLLIGVADDRFDVSYRIRLMAHAAIVVGIFLTDALAVNSIGSILGSGDVTFAGPIAVVFTIIGVLGAINSVNMIDGLDGLLGSICLASILAIFIISVVSVNSGGKSLSPEAVAAVAGALVGFLILNSRIIKKSAARVFLGDAGSTMLGFILVYLLIDFSQGADAAFSPVVAGWILGLPLLDASAVIASRVLDGKSPFKPDRGHLHHILIDSGMSVNATVITMLALHSALIVIAVGVSVLAGAWSDLLLFWGFIVLVLVRIQVVGTKSVVSKPEKKIEHKPVSNASLRPGLKMVGKVSKDKTNTVVNREPKEVASLQSAIEKTQV